MQGKGRLADGALRPPRSSTAPSPRAPTHRGLPSRRVARADSVHSRLPGRSRSNAGHPIPTAHSRLVPKARLPPPSTRTRTEAAQAVQPSEIPTSTPPVETAPARLARRATRRPAFKPRRMGPNTLRVPAICRWVRLSKPGGSGRPGVRRWFSRALARVLHRSPATSVSGLGLRDPAPSTRGEQRSPQRTGSNRHGIGAPSSVGTGPRHVQGHVVPRPNGTGPTLARQDLETGDY